MRAGAGAVARGGRRRREKWQGAVGVRSGGAFTCAGARGAPLGSSWHRPRVVPTSFRLGGPEWWSAVAGSPSRPPQQASVRRE